MREIVHSRAKMGWERIAFGDCAEFINGRAYAQKELLKTGTPVLRIQNLTGGSRWYFSNLALSDDKHCIAGDLLFAWSASFGPYIWDGPRSIFHYHIWKVITKRNLDKKFAYHLLAHLTSELKSSARGIAMLHLTKSGMEAKQISLPPLDEQRRIAAILDQADELRRKRREASAALSSLRQAVFTDKISDEPKPTKLGDIIRVRSGLALTSRDQVGNGPYPVYGGNGINGYYNKYLVEPGTIIIGRVGVYCGSVHLTFKKAWVTDNALIVDILRPDVLPTFLAAALEHANLNQYAGRSAQPLVSGGRIYPVEVQVPSRREQERFSTRMFEISTIAELHRVHLAKLDALFASLQHRAFRGEL